MTSATLNDPLTLPCGATLPNRIAKAAMSEHLGSPKQSPTPGLARLYERWSAGGAGLLITGNVMVDQAHLEAVRNVAVKPESNIDRFREWAAAGTTHGNHLWMQLNHPGRQTPRHLNASPGAPSAVEPVNLFRRANAFGKPHAMDETEIARVIRGFANAAAFAQTAGFTGVQVHGAHGYLVSQFLSPLTNQRSDRWGGSLENRARFARTVLSEIRTAVGDDFPIGIKLNSADFQRGGFTEEESMRVLRMLQEDGIDLVEISGGSYESRVMFDKVENQREAFFLDYAKQARAAVDIPMMVTGGFRARSIMSDALSNGALDVVGMARPFTNNPSIAQDLIDGRTERAEDPPVMPGLGRLGGASQVMMSFAQMGLLAKGKSPTLRFGGLGAVLASLVQESADLFKPKRP
ncbi:MAG: NADH:flavin oxidoreductase/NADH oxidase family protein [Deltaproteobacteria bacterium]|nr:NADH:flavin oxidoreductase/NADH oxidase family protein [Deltaproteobacteria bacterium]